MSGSISSSTAVLNSALASPSPGPASPASVVDQFRRADSGDDPIAKFFEHLAHDDTAKVRPILLQADRVADALGPDDELLDLLLGQSGME